MESTSSKKQQEVERQAAIRRQIAQLQAQLADFPNHEATETSRTPPPSPKRKKASQNTLAPGTPSPKRRRLDDPPNKPAFGKPLPSLTSHLPAKPKPKPDLPSTTHTAVKAGPSNVLTKLASFSKSKDHHEDRQSTVMRSAGFSGRPAPRSTGELGDGRVYGQTRDDELALVEELELGPAEHKAPFDDPHFEYLEPNSGIRLLSRTLLHDDLQDYLRGRYYLSPSKLYSVIRLLPNKQGYDVPVEGDWVTIAVVAERGPVKYSKAPVGVGRDDQEHLSEKDAKLDELIPEADAVDASGKSRTMDLKHWKGKAKQTGPSKPSGKKYINLKLIDFGCRSDSSATGGKPVIRGDAFLSLLLFEADRVEEMADEDGKKRTIYHGGSRGAFERMSKLKEGAVVALLNPKILKPFQRSGDTPHPTDNILAVTPESIDTTVVVGQSRDLGMCKAIKRDGKVCGSWCDKRISDVCDWHVQHAVQARRAGRAEFSMGTSGMSSTAKRKPAYDPSRQWGLKPEPSKIQGEGATYVVSGHVISGGSDTRNLFVGETVGRDAQARAARQSTKDADRALQQLLKRDKDGMKAVAAARAFVKQSIGAKPEKRSKAEKVDLGKRKRRDTSAESDESSEDDLVVEEMKPAEKSAYSAQLIRNLGFDPTSRDGRKNTDVHVQRKLEALAASHASRKDIELGPRPGKKATSVRRPADADHCTPSSSRPSDLSDDELESAETTVFGRRLDRRAEKMVNLDSSDVE